MGMKRLARFALILLASAFAGLCAYEITRVMVARAQTPELIAEARDRADAQIRDLSPHRVAMLVMVEDPSFWTNDGTDFFSPGAGQTTITQGLGKLLYFPRGFKPGFDKIALILIAKFAITPVESKDSILEAFLANAYLGRDAKGEVTGFSEGAERWFGHGLGEISDDEFLALVAMLPAPATLDPLRHAAANAERVRRIKRLVSYHCRPTGQGDVMLEGCKTGETVKPLS
jgi:membrane peptidoglycan carboxypeptidase